MKKKPTYSLVALIAALAGVAWLAWRLWSLEAPVLFRIQELSLWLPTRHFFDTSTIYPGGVLTWAAAFLTQFFFHPAVGVGLLALAWAAIVALSAGVFKLRRETILLGLLPVMALMAQLVQMGYWIYYQKLQGWAWVPTLAVLVVLLLAALLKGFDRLSGERSTVSRVLHWVVLIAVGAVGYPLIGAWSFGALALLALTAPQTLDARAGWLSRLAMPLAAVAMALLAPQLWEQWGYTQLEHKQIYYAAMPCFQYGQNDMDEFRWPYYALVASFVPAWVVMICKGNPGQRSRKAAMMALTGAVVLLALGGWGLTQRWNRDTNFHKEALMTNQIEQLDWEGVLRTMRSSDMGEPMPPTRLMVMMKNLALFRLGRAGDEMFHYPEGSEQYCLCGRRIVSGVNNGNEEMCHSDGSKKHEVVPVRITQLGGKMLYYFYGKEQFAYRWCMEDGVEFGWTVLSLKYMAKTSLITHDWKVARKYLELLKQTRYHRDWALRYEPLVGHPELMEQNDEMKTIIPMSKFSDRLDGDMTLVEVYLLRTFSTGTGADQWYQEMTLICAMIMKDIDLFWPRFRQYVGMHQNEEGFRVPTHYQEAAYLYSMLEPQRPSDMWPGMTNAQALQQIPFDEGVKQTYADFMQFNAQCGAMTEEQKKKAFRPRFGNTFYYFYFLVRGQKTN